MKNKQKHHRPALTLALLLLASLTAPAANRNDSLLKVADSLFQSRQYTESLRLYDSLFRQHYYTPAMLLKMAYVEEALGEVARPLYYLSLYHLATGEESAVKKMQDLSEKHHVTGYRTSDIDRAGWVYHHYHTEITTLLMALAILTFAYMAYLRLRRRERPLPMAFVLLVWLGLLYLHLQLETVHIRGIISQPETLLMAQPSAGGGVIEVLGEGHRLQVTGRANTWTRVRYQDQVGYVKGDRIIEVVL